MASGGDETPTTSTLDDISLGEGEVDIGDYRVQLADNIGSGSFGTVYEATNRYTNEIVAVKKIRYTFRKEVNNEMRDMATSEAETMRIIQHPHIVGLLDFKIRLGSAWLFMPYCDLGDMGSYLKNNPELSIGQRLIMMHQLAKAVDHLHHHTPPIIHRDIKPGNVLVKQINGENRAMLTDFGFAKLYDYSMSITGSAVYRHFQESLKGTPGYMAPEFYMEDPNGLTYTATVDIFSLGLMYSIILEYSEENKNLQPMSVKAKREKRVVNFGFEMSECFKQSETLPCIVEHKENDNTSIQDLKELILKMTAFYDHDRIHIGTVEETLKRIVLPEGILTVDTKSLALEMVGRKLKKVKSMRASDDPRPLKLIDGEIWSCKSNGVSVYDKTLTFVRHIDTGYVCDVALLPRGNVVVAGRTLCEMSKSGDDVNKISRKPYYGVAVHNDQCYACHKYLSQIDVYACSDWQLLRSMQTPGCNTDCWWHTITVSSQYIKVCCLMTGRLIILNLDGQVNSIHGPGFQVQTTSREAANRDGSIKRSLGSPYLCQEDDKGNVLIAEFANDRLLLFTTDCLWYDITPGGCVNNPSGAVWLSGRLYVSSWSDKSITMFE